MFVQIELMVKIEVLSTLMF